MIGFAILLVAGQVLPSSPPADATAAPLELREILQRLGEAEARDVDSPTPCRFKDTTAIEELDRHGALKAKETYRWEIERTDSVVRTVLAVERQGQLSSVLRPKPKQQDKVYRSAFHPKEQPHFRFRLFGGGDPRTLRIQYAPFHPEPDRMTGIAEVDVETMTVKSLAVIPSKLPAFVTAVEIRIDFADTACGHMPVRISAKGEGGFLFYRKLFRSFTLLHDFAQLGGLREESQPVAVQ